MRFRYPAEFDPHGMRRDAFGMFQGTPREVQLRFAPHLADWVESRRWHRSQKLRKEADGHLRLSLRASGDADLVGWILSFGSSVEVLAPDDLRNRVIDELRRAAARFPGSDVPA